MLIKTTKQILRDARDMIADREKWCRYHHAQDDKGFAVPIDDERASCFCADGALIRAGGGTNGETYKEAVESLSQACKHLYGTPFFVDVNDSIAVTPEIAHSQIIAAFNLAIECCNENVEA